MYITIDKVKKHLNIDADFLDDDNYITSLIEVAENVVERHIGYKLSDKVEANDGCLPKGIEHAMLLLIGHFYNTREAVTFGTGTELPLGYNYLLDLFTNLECWG